MTATRPAPIRPAIQMVAAITIAAFALATRASGETSTSAPHPRPAHKAASLVVHSSPSDSAAAPRQAADSTMTLHGGEEGTVFHSLTIEGEDRIHLDVQRPELTLDMDPAKAPGLDWGSARDVLDRTTPDLDAPLLAASAENRSPYVAHPWLSHFASGTVARFHPDVKGVDHWKLSVANARGEVVTTFQGSGEPPREITWNGLAANGTPVLPGLTYSYVFEAHDRAGNKRNFVGEGFSVSAWRLETPAGPVLAFSGSELRAASAAPGARPAASDPPPPVVIEAATWVNQSVRPAQPLHIDVSARSADQANLLGSNVARWIGPLLIGGPERVHVATEVRADAPELGAVRISVSGS
jgi:hypothetical protein